MSELIECPSCNAKVRVPERLLGAKVRCPKCKSTFTAAGIEPDDPEDQIAEPMPESPRRRGQVEENGVDETEDESFEEERPRKRRRRRRRGRRFKEAENAVAAPAICFMVLGGVNIAIFILDLAMRFLNASFFAAAGQGTMGRADTGGTMAGIMTGGCFDVLGVLLAIGIIYGGYKMKQLENHGLAVAVSVLVMLPCCNCCLIGLPLGIWSMVVLNRPEVKDAFS